MTDCPIKETILNMDKAVPRYTSYPTAPNFKPFEDTQIHKDWLKSLPQDGSLSLYLHIPFCKQMCWYCGCHTKATERYDPVEAYVNLILKEINLLAGSLEPRPLKQRHKVRHVHFGGGSPTILKPVDFEKIMERLDQHFEIDYKAGEIAIEIDPRNVDEGKIESYAKCGINRASLGVQDINEQTMRAVNRSQPLDLTIAAVTMLNKHGIKKINMDLLYGLPHQTVESMEKTISRLWMLSPDRISLFGYAHVPWMKKHMRLIQENSLPDNNLRYDLFTAGAEKLAQKGYEPVGIDHFAKTTDPLTLAARAGTLRRNFQGYTVDSADALIGIGASSISKFGQGYVQNAVDMPIYENAINSGFLPIAKYYILSSEDRLRADVIEHLMCDSKVDLPTICSTHGFEKNHLDDVLANLEPFLQQNLLVISKENVLTLSPDARLVARLICAEFDLYFSCAPEKDRHAKAI